MPRSSRSKGVADEGSVDTLEPDEIEDEDVTVDDADITSERDEEDDEDEATPGFVFESKPAPKDFTPDRKTPGRVRQPSYFDDILRRDDVFGRGWQMVPVTSKEHIQAVLRELNRAKLHLNKTAEEGESEIGLDLDVREDAVYYKSRIAQKRERKNGNGGPKRLKDEDEDAIDEDEVIDEEEIDEDDLEDEDEEV